MTFVCYQKEKWMLVTLDGFLKGLNYQILVLADICWSVNDEGDIWVYGIAVLRFFQVIFQ